MQAVQSIHRAESREHTRSARPKQKESAINTPPINAGPAHRKWRIAWLLALGVMISYLDRMNISVA
jgi:hypothetical protein